MNAVVATEVAMEVAMEIQLEVIPARNKLPGANAEKAG